MSLGLRIVFTVVCALLTLVCLVFGVVGIVSVGGTNGAFLAIVCGLLAASFGYFVVHDVNYYVSLNKAKK